MFLLNYLRGGRNLKKRRGHTPRATERFVRPQLEPLEERITPRPIGGVAAQVGSLLAVNVETPAPPEAPGLPGLPDVSDTVILMDGKGDVAVSWDVGPVHVFSGVTTIDLVCTAPGNAVFLFALAPAQTPQTVNLFLQGVVNALYEHVPAGGVPLTVHAQPPVPTLQF